MTVPLLTRTAASSRFRIEISRRRWIESKSVTLRHEFRHTPRTSRMMQRPLSHHLAALALGLDGPMGPCRLSGGLMHKQREQSRFLKPLKYQAFIGLSTKVRILLVRSLTGRSIRATTLPRARWTKRIGRRALRWSTRYVLRLQCPNENR